MKIKLTRPTIISGEAHLAETIHTVPEQLGKFLISIGKAIDLSAAEAEEAAKAEKLAAEEAAKAEKLAAEEAAKAAKVVETADAPPNAETADAPPKKSKTAK